MMSVMEGFPASIDSLDDLLAAVAAVEQANARVALAADRLGRLGDWRADGSLSMACWLETHARMLHSDAARLLREGRFLHRYDPVADAAVAGGLSGGQVHACRSVVSSATAGVFDAHAGGVVDAIRGLSIRDSVVALAEWKLRAEADNEQPLPKERDQELTFGRLPDGTLVGKLVLTAAAAAEFEQALGTAGVFNGAQDTRTVGERQADALVDIVGFFNANHDRPGTPRHRPHVELHVQAGELNTLQGPCGVTADGQLLPTWATDAFLCDCVIHRVLRAAATVADYGRATRSVPANLFRMVVARDGGCRFPHCHRKVAWCDAHHIVWWRRDGETTLENLVLLCGYHHRLIHREPWQIQLHANADVTVTGPGGQSMTSHPHPLARTGSGPPGHSPPVAA